jgi:hypothetical protein
MSGGTISGNTASNGYSSGYGGGVYVNGTFTMTGGTISGNTAFIQGGGVSVNGTFIKTRGILYGDTDNNPDNGNATDNTATFTYNVGTNGHAVIYAFNGGYFYHNETLEDYSIGSISTDVAMPITSGFTANKWTKR